MLLTFDHVDRHIYSDDHSFINCGSSYHNIIQSLICLSVIRQFAQKEEYELNCLMSIITGTRAPRIIPPARESPIARPGTYRKQEYKVLYMYTGICTLQYFRVVSYVTYCYIVKSFYSHCTIIQRNRNTVPGVHVIQISSREIRGVHVTCRYSQLNYQVNCQSC